MSSTLLVSFLPILIVLITIFLVIFIGRSIKRTLNQRGKYVSNHLIKWFVGVYFLFLLISIILYTSIPKGNTVDWKGVREEDVDQADNDFHQAALSGKINTLDQAILEKQWKFDYLEPQLKIQLSNGGGNVNFSVIVEVKDTKDGKIEVYQYRRDSLPNVLIADNLKAMQIHLSGDTLFLTKPDPVRLKFALFKKEFSITQFTGENLSEYPTDFRMDSILYMRIPKDLYVVDEGDLYIERVREKK